MPVGLRSVSKVESQPEQTPQEAQNAQEVHHSSQEESQRTSPAKTTILSGNQPTCADLQCLIGELQRVARDHENRISNRAELV